MFDLAILGGGPGGYVAAERAGAAGLKTVIFEKNSLGGVCLNEGCIPTKTLLYSAKVYNYALTGDHYGVYVKEPSFNYSEIVDRKDKVVKKLVGGVKAAMKAGKVQVVAEHATIKGRSAEGITLTAGGEEYTAKNLLICAGSEASVPPFPGLKEAGDVIVTNREILSLREQPKELVVIGGGVIGMEFAAFFNTLGTKVTVVEMLPKILGPMDDEISSMLQKIYAKRGIEFCLKCKVTGIEGNTVVYEDPDGKVCRVSGDKILVVCDSKDYDFITAFLGDPIEMEWQKLDTGLEARRIMITNPDVNGKTIGKLGLYGGVSFNITRVNRAGIDLVSHANLALQMGDRITIVGTESAIKNVEKLLGNSMLKLRQPNLIPIFLGILLGVVLGSMPFFIPGIPQPVKLGLAGGPLVVSILISRFGPKFKLVTYSTVSANLMMREIGIALFLAGVGLGAGGDFVSTVIDGGGYKWIGYGVIISVLPILLAGIAGRIIFKMDYFTLTGVLAGSSTNPPALAYANTVAGNDMPAVGYATVYPLSMFLRVISAQVLIIIFL